MTRFLSMVNLVHTQEKNRKIQNLKISHLSENLSRRKRPSKLGLDTLKLRVAPFFSLFLSFFRLGRELLYKERDGRRCHGHGQRRRDGARSGRSGNRE